MVTILIWSFQSPYKKSCQIQCCCFHAIPKFIERLRIRVGLDPDHIITLSKCLLSRCVFVRENSNLPLSVGPSMKHIIIHVNSNPT
jgi:hypothetical protein